MKQNGLLNVVTKHDHPWMLSVSRQPLSHCVVSYRSFSAGSSLADEESPSFENAFVFVSRSMSLNLSISCKRTNQKRVKETDSE